MPCECLMHRECLQSELMDGKTGCLRHKKEYLDGYSYAVQMKKMSGANKVIKKKREFDEKKKKKEDKKGETAASWGIAGVSLKPIAEGGEYEEEKGPTVNASEVYSRRDTNQ